MTESGWLSHESRGEPMADSAALNTDRELYRDPTGDLPGDYYADSVHVAADGQIGMNVGGTVVTLPIHEWHRRVLGGQSEPLARAVAAHRAAEAELDRLASGIEGLANEWSGPDSLRANAWVRERDVADRLRSTLRAAGSRIETNGEEVEYAECTCGHYHSDHGPEGCQFVGCGCFR